MKRRNRTVGRGNYPSPLETARSAAANASAVAGRAGRGADSTDAAKAAAGGVGRVAAAGRPRRSGRRRRNRHLASWTPPAGNGCSPVIISYRTTASDQTSSTSSAGRPERTSADA